MTQRYALSDGTFTNDLDKLADDITDCFEKHSKRMDRMHRILERPAYLRAAVDALMELGYEVQEHGEEITFE